MEKEIKTPGEKKGEEKEVKKKELSIIIKVCPDCGRKSHYQDGLYGQGRRVFNRCQGQSSKGEYRCTVCGHIKFN